MTKGMKPLASELITCDEKKNVYFQFTHNILMGLRYKIILHFRFPCYQLILSSSDGNDNMAIFYALLKINGTNNGRTKDGFIIWKAKVIMIFMAQ